METGSEGLIELFFTPPTNVQTVTSALAPYGEAAQSSASRYQLGAPYLSWPPFRSVVHRAIVHNLRQNLPLSGPSFFLGHSLLCPGLCVLVSDCDLVSQHWL